jgi:creatinine amidohydrolase/Fe(II)-dependent formamide hydrolase-like protein
MEKSLTIQSNCISRLSIEEIRLRQEKNQSLVVPLSGLEPFGSVGVSGIPGICSEALAYQLARRCASLVAPLIPYASSPAFKAFPGCVSIGSRVYENMLLNLCESWNFQGFKRILLINSAFMPDHALERALKRLEGLPENGAVRLFSWQSDKRVREKILSETGLPAFDRFEFSLLSIAFYIDKESIRDIRIDRGGVRVTLDEYKRWKKRGADPEKYRKLFKDGISSEGTERVIDKDLGKILFRYILDCMFKDFSSFLQADSFNAA